MNREHGPIPTEEAARDPVEELAETFLERLRRGERPSIEEYAEGHPDLAGRIRDLFPALLAMEEAGPEETRAEESPPPRRQEEPIERLGEYRVLREIGRGGMGVVYEAEQETLGRRVALKVLLHAGLSDEVDLERFRREARAAARLHHTNIVGVFGIGEDGGTHYYAMQYIHGQSLASVLSEVRRARFDGVPAAGAGPPGSAGSTSGLLAGGAAGSGREPHAEYHRNVARLGLQAAEALAYAHGEGVLHRDIKPSNLLLDTRGFLWVTDFGLAKAGDSGDLTARGSVVGTLRYMAPERLGGVEDARSDVYSLGVTLYEALTLRPAFDSTDRARLVQDLAAREPPAPRAIDPAIPRDLETIVLKAIAKTPRDRYATAADLTDDLRRFLAYEPVKARRATVHERLWRWCQRNPTVAVLCGAVAVLLTALAAGGMLSARSLRKERDQTFGLLMASKLEEGRAWRRSGSLGQRVRSLAAFRDAAAGRPALALRNEVIGSLVLADMEVELAEDMPEGGIADDEHLERSAVRGPGNSILVFGERPSKEPISILPGRAHPPREMLFSPSSRFLAVREGGPEGPLAVWDIEREETLLEVPAPLAGMPVAFHPREDSIALADAAGGIVLRSFPGGAEVRRLPPGPRPRKMSFDPDGRRLAVVALDPGAHVVRLHDVEAARLIGRLHHPDDAVDVAWHPRGGLLATACQDFNVYLWDAATGKRVTVLEGHGAEVRRVTFSHGGGLLASAGWDNQTFLWDAFSGERLVNAPGIHRAFSRDDARLGFSEGTRKLGTWKLAGGSEHRLLPVPSDSRRDKRPMDIAISPDGRWLAAECGHRGARVWSLGAPDQALDLEIGWTEGVRFHPAGGSLLTGGAAGLLRWPIRADEDGRGWTFGPAEPLGLPGGRLSLDAAGRSVAIVRGSWIFVHDLKAGKELARVEHGNAHRADLSPSGRWLVSTTWQGSEVRVWEARGGGLATTFPSRSAHARWSPDERWLAVGTEAGFWLREAGTWTIRHRLGREGGGDMPGTIAFSSDSRFVALVRSLTHAHLHRTETGEEVASLQPLGPGYGGWMEISSSGGFLAMAAPTLQAVKLWDLAAIRRELAALGLDWDDRLPGVMAPPPSSLRVEYGTAAPGGGAGSPNLRARDLSLLETVTRWLDAAPDAEHLMARAALHRRLGSLEEALADLDALVAIERERFAADPSPVRRDGLAAAFRARAEVRAETGRVGEAIEDLASVAALDPDDSRAIVEAAWLWAAAPNVEGDAGRLLSAIEAAAAGRPADPRVLAALGAVYYRLDRLAEAGTLLHEAYHMEGEEAPAQLLLVLAMLSHRTGRTGEARAHLERAAAAIEKGPPGGTTTARARRLRAEAERALGSGPD